MSCPFHARDDGFVPLLQSPLPHLQPLRVARRPAARLDAPGSAPEGPDCEWLQRAIDSDPPYKIGFFASLPNALLAEFFGVLDFVVAKDNALGWFFCAGAPVILALSTLVPWFRNTRLRFLRRRNSLT